MFPISSFSFQSLLGLLGRYYAARHSHGHYRSCAITGVYKSSKQSEDHFTKLLSWSLKRTIERHPSLCYGITEKQGKTEAQFVPLKTVNWGDVVEFRISNLPSGDVDEALSKQLGIDHQHLWKEQDHKPAWKIIVLKLGNGAWCQNPRLYVTYINHHALGDSTSCAAFHRTLHKCFLQALSKTDLDIQ
jgi:hypothetical protein